MENKTYNFEKWTGGPKLRSFLPCGRNPYVRFSFTKSIYISTAILGQSKSKSDEAFDILVDRDRRVFALKFCETGQFKVTTIPAMVGGMAGFVNEFHPKLDERIRMKHDETSGLWVGHLDGGKVDILEVGSSKDGKNE